MESCTPVRFAFFASREASVVISCSTVVACGDVWLAAIPCGVRGHW